MNVETLRLFCDVVRYQSFSRGAAANGVSQSAASQAVHQIERSLGVQMVDRSKRPFVVTPEGEACHKAYRDVLDRYDAVPPRVRSISGEIAGSVRVAAIYSVGLHDMTACMQEFMRRYPKAKVRLEYLRPNKAYEAVLSEEADLALVSYPVASRSVTVIPFREETMVLVCSPAHRLAGLRKATVRHFQNEDFVAFDRDLIIRKKLDDHLRQAGATVRVVMEFDNIETIKQAVQIGAGISILPETTVRHEIETGVLVGVPLATRKLTRPLGIVYRKRKAITPTMAKFIELLKNANGAADAPAT